MEWKLSAVGSKWRGGKGVGDKNGKKRSDVCFTSFMVY